MTKLPIGITPRGLTREQAAEYCDCETAGAFVGWIKRGIVSGLIPGTHRWDRKAIDHALDCLSGLLSNDSSAIADRWLAEYDRNEREGR